MTARSAPVRTTLSNGFAVYDGRCSQQWIGNILNSSRVGRPFSPRRPFSHTYREEGAEGFWIHGTKVFLGDNGLGITSGNRLALLGDCLCELIGVSFQDEGLASHVGPVPPREFPAVSRSAKGGPFGTCDLLRVADWRLPLM